MPKIFLLTAPFDETAHTGDGQYAKTLENTFKLYYPNISCTWLKRASSKTSGYVIDYPEGTKSIPDETIPSAAVLRMVANEKTITSGFQLMNTDSIPKGAMHVFKMTTSPRTPKIILGKDGLLQSLSIKSIYHSTPLILNKGAINNELEYIKEKKNLLKWIGKKNELVSEFKKKNDLPAGLPVQTIAQLFANFFAKTDANPDNILTLSELITYLFCPAIFSPKLETALNSISTLSNFFDKKINLENQSKLEQLINDFTGIRQYHYDFNSHRIPVSKEDVMSSNIRQKHIKDIITLLKDSFYQKTTLSAKDSFELAYHSNKNDPTKIPFIDSVISEISPDQDGNTYVDIHIRPPDCGVFITENDIQLLRHKNIKVNLTIHEYEQNYRRRHLQKYTHDLMREADSVLFFNEKDRNSAILAATHGDCDEKNWNTIGSRQGKFEDLGHDYESEKHAVTPYYDLEAKSGLTVASQQLGLQDLGDIEDILEKLPNILCFGTIRPGKGFIQALKLAQILKADPKPIRIEREQLEQEHYPIMIIAGDPQDPGIMTALVNERFGEEQVAEYQRESPYYFNSSADTSLATYNRTYWKLLIDELNQRGSANGNSLNNPYIDVHAFCSKEELFRLQSLCKYVLRMDDMGMRNNASAIISCLHCGITYAKFGLVTDDIYAKGGKYADAVDIGEYRFGKYNQNHPNNLNNNQTQANVLTKKKLRKLTPCDEDLLKDDSRDPCEVLNSIRTREDNQFKYRDNIKESLNYRTVTAVRELLKEHFALHTPTNKLLEILGLKAYTFTPKPDTIFETDIRTETNHTIDFFMTMKGEKSKSPSSIFNGLNINNGVRNEIYSFANKDGDLGTAVSMDSNNL